MDHMGDFLRSLLENKLFVKAEKCEFNVSTVKFVGYVVEKGQFGANLAQIDAVRGWPLPATCKQRCFLWFLNFSGDSFTTTAALARLLHG